MPGSLPPGPVPGIPGAATFYESARRHRASSKSQASRLRVHVPSAIMYALTFVLVGGWEAARFGLFRQKYAKAAIAAAVLILAITVWAGLFLRAVRNRRERMTDGSRVPALSIDQRGVTLHHLGARLDWAQIREIVIEREPLLPLRERFAVGSSWRIMIVFIPTGPASGQGTALDHSLAGRFRRLYGSPFAVDISLLSTGSDKVIRAIREAAPCPIRGLTR